MKNHRSIGFVLAALLLATMACSLLPFGKDEAPEPTVAAVQEPAALPTEIPEGSSDASKDPSRAGYKIAPLNQSRLWDEEQPTDISMTMLMELTTDPLASHVTMTTEGMDMGELGDTFNIEMYIIDEKIYMTGFLGDSWMVMSDESSDFTDDMFVDPEEFVDAPPQAWRAPDPEMINGVSTWHYAFDEEDVMEFAPESVEDLEFDSMIVDMWVAVDGGHMVRMEATMEGIKSTANEDMGLPEGEVHQMHMVYNVLEINTPFTIELPPEAANAEPFDPLGILGEMDEVDDEMLENLPLPDDAEITFSVAGMLQAETSWSFDETKDWMFAELAALGWVVDTEFGSAADGYMAFFNMGEKSLSLTLTETENGTSIVALMD